MSIHKFDEECPGCRPAVLDITTGKLLDDGHPMMQTVNAVWSGTSRREREAYHKVMCQNSRDTVDLELVRGVVQRMEAACKEVR